MIRPSLIKRGKFALPAEQDYKSIGLGLTVSHPFFRYLLLWFFIALQTMTPFIHAHAGENGAGTDDAGHAGFLHAHQVPLADAARQLKMTDQHGPEIEVAQGALLRHDCLALIEARLTCAAVERPRASTTSPPGADMPSQPSPMPGLPDHALPHALAPPSA